MGQDCLQNLAVDGILKKQGVSLRTITRSAQRKDQQRALVETAKNLRVP
jgi:hypothetical protein